MLPAATSCKSGFQRWVRAFSMNAISAFPRRPSRRPGALPVRVPRRRRRRRQSGAVRRLADLSRRAYQPKRSSSQKSPVRRFRLHRHSARVKPILPAARCDLPLGGLPKAEIRPHRRERTHQMCDVTIAMQRRWGQPQPLGAARHRRIVDRLHIDAVMVEQAIADHFTQCLHRRR